MSENTGNFQSCPQGIVTTDISLKTRLYEPNREPFQPLWWNGNGKDSEV